MDIRTDGLIPDPGLQWMKVYCAEDWKIYFFLSSSILEVGNRTGLKINGMVGVTVVLREQSCGKHFINC